MVKSESKTSKLAHLISATPMNAIPASAMSKAKECILDTIGCALGGVQDEINRSIYEHLIGNSEKNRDSRSRRGGASTWGQAQKLPLTDSVLFNGILSHTLEMDDVHRISKVHAGTVIIPAAIGVGESVGASGPDLLRATVMAYEVTHRLGKAINVTAHRNRGWHSTATIGVFGAAIAAGILLGLKKEQLTSAMGLAGTQSSGLWAFLADGAANKRFHAGMAARNGVHAAQIASVGLTGPTFILEAHDGGLFPAMSENFDLDSVTEEWGKQFLIEGVSVKPFACCRSMHPPIQAVLELREEHGLTFREVKEVQVETYSVAKKQCDAQAWPKSTSAAQFNMRYGIAVALRDGEALVKQFSSERIQDPSLLENAPNVKILATREFEEGYPREWGCRVRITLHDANTMVKTIRFPKGDPENPLSRDELRLKFYSLAGVALGRQRSEELVGTLENLEKLQNIQDLELQKTSSSA